VQWIAAFQSIKLRLITEEGEPNCGTGYGPNPLTRVA
jgi:hypothetical protein